MSVDHGIWRTAWRSMRQIERRTAAQEVLLKAASSPWWSSGFPNETRRERDRRAPFP